jgi:hypothetical protein
MESRRKCNSYFRLADYLFALASTNKDKWLEAIDKELSALGDAGTWIMVPHQSCMNILPSNLVLKAKRDTAGEIIKCKARLVAGGDAQVHGLDFDQSYAPRRRFHCRSCHPQHRARGNLVVCSAARTNEVLRIVMSTITVV